MGFRRVTEGDRLRAERCARCATCARARTRPRSLTRWYVVHIGRFVCPNCRSYERVYGRQPWRAAPPPTDDDFMRAVT